MGSALPSRVFISVVFSIVLSVLDFSAELTSMIKYFEILTLIKPYFLLPIVSCSHRSTGHTILYTLLLEKERHPKESKVNSWLLSFKSPVHCPRREQKVLMSKGHGYEKNFR